MRIDNTLSLFADALATVAGRLVGFFLTILLGATIAYVAFHGARSLPDVAWLPVLWASGIATGAFQLWGLLTYTILAIAFVCLVHYEWDPVTCLAFVFVVQSAETFRCLVALGGPGPINAGRTVVLAVIWSLALMLWGLRVLASRYGWVAFGPLGRVIGAPVRPAGDTWEDEEETEEMEATEDMEETVVWENVDPDDTETRPGETS